MNTLSKELINSKEEWVFEYFYTKYANKLKACAMYMVNSNAFVDDIVQETFIQFYYKAGIQKDFESETHVRNYLYTVCRGKAIKAWKKRSVELFSNSEDGVTDLMNDILMTEKIRTVYGAISNEKNSLPVSCRNILIKIYVEGRTVGETAKDLGLGRTTVSTYLTRGTQMLKEILFNGNRSGAKRPAYYSKGFEILKGGKDLRAKELAAILEVTPKVAWNVITAFKKEAARA